MGLKKESSDGLFLEALKELSSKGAAGHPKARQLALSYARDMLAEKNGFEAALYYSPLFESANLFVSTPWETPSRLKPGLVRGTLLAGGLTAVNEMLSDLRILAISLGIYEKPDFSREAASRFIDEVLVLNLDLASSGLKEKATLLQNRNMESLAQFFSFIAQNQGSTQLLEKLTAEIEELSAQRPILNSNIVNMIEAGQSLSKSNGPIPDRFLLFKNALQTPTAFTRLYRDNYQGHLEKCREDELKAESEQFVKSMTDTGIVSGHHVTFIKFISRNYPGLLSNVLGLNKNGKNKLTGCLEEIRFLIDKFLFPETRQSIYGLARFLNSESFSDKVLTALCSLATAPMKKEIAERLEKSFGIMPEKVNGMMIAGTVSLLGSPLGVGQGNNPTCQSTRALCYWAQTSPEYLLELVRQAVTFDEIEMEFEGQKIISSHRKSALDLSVPMDPVSVILLPHLDRLYNEMLKMAGGRNEDPHKWVNPAFYGGKVLSGFASIYNNPGFQLLFKNYYSPESPFAIHGYLPQPAGIFILDDQGNNLGAHAILIQRVGFDPNNVPRVYFYNPNNDSRQTWAGSIVTSIMGHGEEEGEGSLPLEDFLICLYAFHYPEVK